MNSAAGDRIIQTLLFISAFAVICACSSAQAACQLVRVADLPIMFLRGDVPSVSADFKGRPLRMLIDTGAEASFITPAAVRELGGSDVYLGGAKLIGMNGSVLTAATLSRPFQLGDVTVENEVFFISDLSFPADADGVIGEDILSSYNIALDFPHNKIALFEKGQCDLGFPWAGRFATMHFRKSIEQAPEIRFFIDGHAFHGIIDTGASKLMVTRQALSAAGVVPDAIAAPELGIGIGNLTAKVEVERFSTLIIGGEMFGPSWLRVVDKDRLEDGDALIGSNYLDSHQVYISNDTDIVWLGTAIPKH